MRSVSFTMNLSKVHGDGTEPSAGADPAMLVKLRRHSYNMQVMDRQRNRELLGASKEVNSSGRRSVQFGHVFIREYERALGDSPCSTGPPIGLGWKYWAFDPTATAGNENSGSHQTEGVFPLDEYESMNFPKIPAKKLLLCRFTREELLIENGFSRKELVDAVRQNIKLKNQRRQTVTNLRLEPLEVVLERCAKTMKRLVPISAEQRKRESSRRLYKEWLAEESRGRSCVGQPTKGILKKTSWGESES